MSYFSDDDLYHFSKGTSTKVHDRLGAHICENGTDRGTHFAVWAPSARSVQVIGDFNDWDAHGATMTPVAETGIWYGFVPNVGTGSLYKYRVEGVNGEFVDKSDPVGFRHEVAPRTASVVTCLEYSWSDSVWMAERGQRNSLSAPMCVYELHLGSWKKLGSGEPPNYRELAPLLVDYMHDMGFTHVEFMPLAEHPFYGSWGYQVTGYFAATSRYGTPQDLMFLVDALHEAGVGVILDLVPAHFPTDAHSLGDFDGTHLYEHADPRAGFHPDWNTYIFNYGRHEVRGFLISSALFWLEYYHIDALRVDGVASMLYLDYSRRPGEWVPNKHGGNHNLEAIAFLQQLNTAVYREFSDVQTIAEESTAFPRVSRPVECDGLGFGLKWDMGWMHDTLEYFSRDPLYRCHHQLDLTKRTLWAFTENFMLPLSHDEVVHGKGSLLDRMPGDEWQRCANLRVLYAHMYGSPGKKLMFMGSELGAKQEWSHDGFLPWALLDAPLHVGIQRLVRALNRLYRRSPELHELDCDPAGFQWLHTLDSAACVLVYARSGKSGAPMLVILNLTPIPRDAYRLGVPSRGQWHLRLNTDAAEFGGSAYMDSRILNSETVPFHGRDHSVVLNIPPLSATFWSLTL